MPNPLVSYVIPCYNCETTLVDTVTSIFNSRAEARKKRKLEPDMDEIEVILCNDGSTDFTLDIIKELHKEYPQVKSTSWLKNKGKGFTRQYGNIMAKADIIAVLDSDDWNIVDENVSREDVILKAFKDAPEASVFYSGFLVHHIHNGQIINKEPEPINKYYLWETGQWWISHSTLAYRKEAILKEPYSEDKNKDDWSLLWNFYSKGYKFCFDPRKLVRHRITEEGIKKEENPEKMKRILEKKRNIMRPFFKSKGEAFINETNKV